MDAYAFIPIKPTFLARVLWSWQEPKNWRRPFKRAGVKQKFGRVGRRSYMHLNACEVNTCFTPTRVGVASFFQRFQKPQDKWPHSFVCAVLFGKFWGDRYGEILYKLSVELHKSYNCCRPAKKHRGLAAIPSRCLRRCVNIVLQIQPVLNAGILQCVRCLFLKQRTRSFTTVGTDKPFVCAKLIVDFTY